MLNSIVENLSSKQATIGIIGLGYVGLPLLIRFSEAGFKTLGIDIDKEKVDLLNLGKSYIEHINSLDLQAIKENDGEATSDFSRVGEADALIICVPTPLNKYREPDLSFILNTIELISPFLRSGQIVSLESTTYPGTTHEEVLPRIEKKGFKVGQDFFVVYSPEREDPGNLEFTTNTIPKIVGGETSNCLKAGVALYEHAIEEVVPVSSTQTAEMTKLLENIYRAVNIGLVNEMKIVSDKMGIDIHEVINAAATKPFGFTPYYPGPGLGGHCIPIDPFYLTWKAREYGIHTRFIELAGEINTSMPQWVVGKCIEALNFQGKALKDSKILVLGLAYKKDVGDMRESPSVELMEILRDKGSIVNYTDPFIDSFPLMRDHQFNLDSIDISDPTAIQVYDLVILSTNHSSFDYENIKANSNLLVDTRGVYSGDDETIIKA
jgi:UDP-N-acetyl-D-glucosamine dehydrogenase